MLNFNFSGKGLGLISPSYFVYDFWRKMFLKLHSINWPNFVVWLPLLLQILGNMCIATVCCPGCDVIKFEINLVVLIKPLCYMAKKSRQKLKYLENEKSVKYKVFFIIFRGLSSAKKFLRLENAPLKLQLIILSYKCRTDQNICKINYCGVYENQTYYCGSHLQISFYGLTAFNFNCLNKLLENIFKEQKSFLLLGDFNVNLLNYRLYMLLQTHYQVFRLPAFLTICLKV